MSNEKLMPYDCSRVDIYFSRNKGCDPFQDAKARMSIEKVLKKYAPIVKGEKGLEPYYQMGCCYAWIGVRKGMEREEFHNHLVEIKKAFKEAGIDVDNFGYIS